MTMNSPAKPRPALWFAILSIVMYFALQLAGSVVAGAIGMARNPALAAKVEAKSPGALMELVRETAIEQIAAIIAAALIMLAIIFFYTKARRPQITLGLRRGSSLPTGQTIKIVAFAGVGSVALVMLWALVLSTWKGANFDPQPEITQMIKNIPQSAINMGIMAGAIAVFGPLVEEVMFRGLLQNALMKYGAPIAIVVSAAVFGASHLQPYAFPALFAMGLALAWVYHRTGSLLLVFLLHLANNASALAFS